MLPPAHTDLIELVLGLCPVWNSHCPPPRVLTECATGSDPNDRHDPWRSWPARRALWALWGLCPHSAWASPWARPAADKM